MLKQPVGQKLLTNVSIVRLKIDKGRFEICCYPNKVQDYRDKKEKDIDEVLQINQIYKNAIKGEVIPKRQLEETFPNMKKSEIIKLILEKGEIQLGDKERENEASNLKKYIATIIVEKTYDTSNGLPFPMEIIIKVLDDIHFSVHDGENAKKQAMRAIKEIQDKKALSIERRMLQLKFCVRNAEKCAENQEKLLNFLKEIEAEIINNNLDNKNFEVVCNIKPSFYREILNKFNKDFNILILNQGEISYELKKKVEDEKISEIEKNKIIFENLKHQEAENEFKISNTKVDDYLEENFDFSTKKTAKKITCTKCKDSQFENREQLRDHCKSNWHKFNVLKTSKGSASLSAEEYDEYVLTHPEELR